MDVLETMKEIQRAYPWETIVVAPEISSGSIWKLMIGRVEYILNESRKRKATTEETDGQN
jgi:hypothetical protein